MNILNINPHVPIGGSVWSVCRVLQGLIFYWSLLLISSKPAHGRFWAAKVSSHGSIIPSPAATSPPEPPKSYTHTDRKYLRYLYLPPRETGGGLVSLCALITLKVIMGTLCHCYRLMMHCLNGISVVKFTAGVAALSARQSPGAESQCCCHCLWQGAAPSPVPWEMLFSSLGSAGSDPIHVHPRKSSWQTFVGLCIKNPVK